MQKHRKLSTRLKRNAEAFVGNRLINWKNKRDLRMSDLRRHNIYIPKYKIKVHYLERSGFVDSEANSDEEIEEEQSSDKTRTLLVIHGLSNCADNMVETTNMMDIPDTVRVIIIDLVGHGDDLKRAYHCHQNSNCDEIFSYPTGKDLVNIVYEFMQMINLSDNVDVIGYSLGGAIAYWLRKQHPTIINRTVLVSPSLQSCLSGLFLQEVMQLGEEVLSKDNDKNNVPLNNFFDWETRKDVKCTFEKLGPVYCDQKNDSVGEREQGKKVGVPNFLLESILRRHQAQTPPGHYRKFIHYLHHSRDDSCISSYIPNAGLEKEEEEKSCWYYTEIDVDHNSPRLVIWPTNDYICDHSKGQTFFAASPQETTIFASISDCGHLFDIHGLSLHHRICPLITNYLYNDGYSSSSENTTTCSSRKMTTTNATIVQSSSCASTSSIISSNAGNNTDKDNIGDIIPPPHQELSLSMTQLRRQTDYVKRLVSEVSGDVN